MNSARLLRKRRPAVKRFKPVTIQLVLRLPSPLAYLPGRAGNYVAHSEARMFLKLIHRKRFVRKAAEGCRSPKPGGTRSAPVYSNLTCSFPIYLPASAARIFIQLFHLGHFLVYLIDQLFRVFLIVNDARMEKDHEFHVRCGFVFFLKHPAEAGDAPRIGVLRSVSEICL